MIVVIGLVAAVVFQGRGHHHDTYQSVYGTPPDHPFNRRRFAKMFNDAGKQP